MAVPAQQNCFVFVLLWKKQQQLIQEDKEVF